MTSYEPTRCTAYDEDLHWRMVWQREALGYGYVRIACKVCGDKELYAEVWLCSMLLDT